MCTEEQELPVESTSLLIIKYNLKITTANRDTFKLSEAVSFDNDIIIDKQDEWLYPPSKILIIIETLLEGYPISLISLLNKKICRDAEDNTKVVTNREAYKKINHKHLS